MADVCKMISRRLHKVMKPSPTKPRLVAHVNQLARDRSGGSEEIPLDPFNRNAVSESNADGPLFRNLRSGCMELGGPSQVGIVDPLLPLIETAGPRTYSTINRSRSSGIKQQALVATIAFA